MCEIGFVEFRSLIFELPPCLGGTQSDIIADFFPKPNQSLTETVRPNQPLFRFSQNSPTAIYISEGKPLAPHPNYLRNCL